MNPLIVVITHYPGRERYPDKLRHYPNVNVLLSHYDKETSTFDIEIPKKALNAQQLVLREKLKVRIEEIIKEKKVLTHDDLVKFLNEIKALLSGGKLGGLIEANLGLQAGIELTEHFHKISKEVAFDHVVPFTNEGDALKHAQNWYNEKYPGRELTLAENTFFSLAEHLAESCGGMYVKNCCGKLIKSGSAAAAAAGGVSSGSLSADGDTDVSKASNPRPDFGGSAASSGGESAYLASSHGPEEDEMIVAQAAEDSETEPDAKQTTKVSTRGFWARFFWCCTSSAAVQVEPEEPWVKNTKK